MFTNRYIGGADHAELRHSQKRTGLTDELEFWLQAAERTKTETC
jgi:hypothetical protein